MRLGGRRRATWLCLVALAAGACAPARPQRCHRYDVAALTPENGFAVSIDWPYDEIFDAAPERIDVAMLIARPVKGPIELVHVVGEREVARWTLMVPDLDQSSVCWIVPGGAPPPCGALMEDVPHVPGGYYYLRSNGNRVIEAGLAFYLCD